MALGWHLRPKTLLVEGTSDVSLFQLAASLENNGNGIDLLGNELAIIAAGIGDRGGTRGVIRELVSLRCFARTVLLPNGSPRYRFIGLFDDDKAGRQAVKFSHDLDTSILEYKDVFRLQPEMPVPGNLDPKTLKKTFEKSNFKYNGIEWELEDLLSSELFEAFAAEYPGAIVKEINEGGKVHHEMTRDGKAHLHHFIAKYAMHEDLIGVINALKAIRSYLCLPEKGQSD